MRETRSLQSSQHTLPSLAATAHPGLRGLPFRLWFAASGPVRALAYGVYSRQLQAEVMSGQLPRHIGMVLDGNRRFARRAGLDNTSEGHRYGAQKVEEFIRWCNELVIPEVTLWGLSIDNLKRPPSELEALFEVIGQGLDRFGSESGRAQLGRRVRVVGRVDLLPDWLQARIRQVESQTAGDGPFAVNVALAYGGREEIVDAVRRMLYSRIELGESARQIAESLTTDSFRRFLHSPESPEPDLIIRTSGEIRLSGFLLWQSVYSELHFCSSTWPAFRKIDFLRAIRSYQQRQRRFGR